MKKVISVALALIMMLSVFSVAAFAAGNTLSLVLATDIHYSANGGNTYKGNLFDYSEAILDAFLKNAAAGNASAVLLAGDLVDVGNAANAQFMAGKLAAFEAETGKQVYVIDGNHDVNSAFSKAAFKSAYAQFGYDEAVALDDASCSYAVDLDAKTRLIAVDSVDANGNGYVNAAVLDWTKQQYVSAKKDGYTVLIMMHHALVEHFPMMNSLLPGYVLTNGEEVAAALANIGISFVFTGHDHITDIASYTNNAGTDVYDIGTGSLTAANCPYRTVTVSDDSIKIGLKTISAIDGFDGDFAAYAKKYFKDNATGLVLDKLNTQFLAGRLGLEKDSQAYSLIDTVIATVKEYGDYPMVQLRALASAKKVSIPDNGYASFNDAFMEFFENIVAGDENINASTELYKVLYGSVQTMLSYAFDNISDEQISAAVNELVPAITSKISDKLPADALSGIVDGLMSGNKSRVVSGLTQLVFFAVVTDFGVDDRPADHSAGFINPFTHEQAAKSQSAWEKILAFFHRILDFIISLFHI